MSLEGIEDNQNILEDLETLSSDGSKIIFKSEGDDDVDFDSFDDREDF